eukprot:6463003-Amphidinium_carterae.1
MTCTALAFMPAPGQKRGSAFDSSAEAHSLSGAVSCKPLHALTVSINARARSIALYYIVCNPIAKAPPGSMAAASLIQSTKEVPYYNLATSTNKQAGKTTATIGSLPESDTHMPTDLKVPGSHNSSASLQAFVTRSCNNGSSPHLQTFVSERVYAAPIIKAGVVSSMGMDSKGTTFSTPCFGNRYT